MGKDNSIEESNNRREYVFDKKTNLLKALKIYLVEDKTETLMLEMKDIKYNIPVDSDVFNLQLPQDLQCIPSMAVGWRAGEDRHEQLG